MSQYELPEDDVATYSRAAILVAAAVGLAVAALLAWAASGFDVFYEELFRVGPTVEGGGVGANWVEGNTMPALDFLIALIHAADVIMGVFILFLLFVHWAAFRRLAARMRQPGERGSGVAADGGTERLEGDARRPDGEAGRPDGEARRPDGDTQRTDGSTERADGGGPE